MHLGMKPLDGAGQFDPNDLLGQQDGTSPNDIATPDASGQTLLYGDVSCGSATSAGGSGSGGTTSVVSSSTGSTSPFVINITWDSSVASAPSAFKTAVIAAAQYLESQFTDHVTLNINVGYGEVAGSSMGSGALGESESYLSSYSYASVKAALAADGTSADDAAVLASLPATAPVNGTIWLTTAQAKALGLSTATSTSTDGFVGFAKSLPFSYTDTNGVVSGTYDFNGVALHELTEVMGRMMFTGGSVGSYTNSYSLMDLLHYSASGVRDLSASKAGYLSANGGVTSLGAFNTVSGGDSGDWASSVTNNAFDAFSSSGSVNGVTLNDLREMDLLGWNRAAGTSLTAAVSPLTTGLGSVTSGASLITVSSSGGTAGDAVSYTLGGTGAASFTLTQSGSAATIGIKSGTASGLYSLTVTPTDTTAEQVGTGVTMGVVVQTAASATLSLSTIASGLGLAAPEFIYALGKGDKVVGTGITGSLWIDGGAGGDTLTGGSGANDYLFGATTASTPSAMDIITNFHIATDKMDFSGLTTALKVVGTTSATTLAADSLAWQTSGGNTFVYVNTSGASESLTATNMKVELQGSIALTTGNILHA